MIHAPTSSVISADDLARIPPEGWPDVRLAANPSLVLLHLDYPANAFFHAVRHDESPDVPGPAATHVAVYRTGTTHLAPRARRAAMATLFEALAAGATLSAAIERVAPQLSEMSEADAAASVMSGFRSGVSSGLFRDVLID